MEIERTTFGTITIDGKTYEHDVIIRLSGEVARRKKKLSKKYYGTSHVLSKDEAKFVFENGCEQLILGSGQMGNVHLSPEAEAYFAKKGCAGRASSKSAHVCNATESGRRGLNGNLMNPTFRCRHGATCQTVLPSAPMKRTTTGAGHRLTTRREAIR
ncbi:hypothetical protein [Bradyrhizobium sp. sBnM-33]|uniref:hypothetical protein n=1 Tax=Bradyrhizobium sp. sBnM-33 TaxID=2831780 RepID=UPI001BCAF6F1|nr:hypothetical protein [Bradyrhizobium sp. sBnM-33]WOH47527.1 hypothetical protein RX328_25475 [Bradyrhizobium sp. sBnM-33]